MVTSDEDLFYFPSRHILLNQGFFKVSLFLFIFRSGPGRSQAGGGRADHERRSSLADGGHARGHPQPQDRRHAPACGRRQGLPWGHQVRNSPVLSRPLPGPLELSLSLSLQPSSLGASGTHLWRTIVFPPPTQRALIGKASEIWIVFDTQALAWEPVMLIGLFIYFFCITQLT